MLSLFMVIVTGETLSCSDWFLDIAGAIPGVAPLAFFRPRTSIGAISTLELNVYNKRNTVPRKKKKLLLMRNYYSLFSVIAPGWYLCEYNSDRF